MRQLVWHYTYRGKRGDTHYSALLHIDQAGYNTTLCGVKHDAPVDGSESPNGWQLSQGDMTEVGCRRCYRIDYREG